MKARETQRQRIILVGPVTLLFSIGMKKRRKRRRKEIVDNLSIFQWICRCRWRTALTLATHYQKVLLSFMFDCDSQLSLLNDLVCHISLYDQTMFINIVNDENDDNNSKSLLLLFIYILQQPLSRELRVK